MASQNFSVLLLTLFFLALFSFTAAQPTYVYHDCPNTTTFVPNTTYQRNLNSVLSSLSSNSTRLAGFHRVAVGSSHDAVYGLFLCRGDLSVRTCQTCVDTARKEITKRCPVEKVSIIFYDECMLRYSDVTFFSIMQENPMFRFYNTTKVSDTARFLDIVFGTMRQTTNKAAKESSGKRFATGKANFMSSQMVYTLAQCTRDLSVPDCERCLQVANGNLPADGSRGGRMLLPSCNVRFELFPFYNETAASSPAAPGILPDRESSKLSSSIIVAIFVPVGFFVLLVFFGCCFIRWRVRNKYKAYKEESVKDEISIVESLQFDLATIQAATDNFACQNKLGEGGFGEVYKGRLLTGEEIAVKRLSKSSKQGAEEFKNEVILVAKLQHRNLVRLLGFCYEGEERILVYEFVPNKSLDHLLFDPENQGKLDWLRRYKIIGGIARGMLYLHEDSRLRIIHRDLKASNILLDGNMNPKISDFGMARIFGVDQTQGTTKRIVGTYGYMSPEYAMRGYFSVKSDVYSFGVLLLEIISGKRNSDFYQSDCAEDLLSYVWKKWKGGAALEVVDPSIRYSCSRNEVMRCLHLALSCIQESPSNRPMMATIVLMLDSHSISLPLPQRPAYLLHSRTDPHMARKDSDSDVLTSNSTAVSVNELSVSEIYPR